jgi:hypothetical protein
MMLRWRALFVAVVVGLELGEVEIIREFLKSGSNLI